MIVQENNHNNQATFTSIEIKLIGVIPRIRRIYLVYSGNNFITPGMIIALHMFLTCFRELLQFYKEYLGCGDNIMQHL